MTQFRIDIETPAGSTVGDGPILSATHWDSTPRLSKAGTFKFSMPASDPRAAQIVAKRVARCYTLIGSTMTVLGAGIIDKISVSIDAKGNAILNVSGDDLLRELTNRNVQQLEISDGAGGADTTGPADIMALAPAGWTITNTDGSTPATSATAILHTFEGETVLAALVRLASMTGENFRLGTGRTVVWLKTDQPASGIRAITGGDPVSLESNTNVCLITDLQEEQDTFDLASRIYPYGAGDGDARFTLDGFDDATWNAAHTGYTMVAASNYIKRDATETAYGQIERYVSFKDLKNADALVEQAYNWLVRFGAVYKSYRLNVTKLDTVILPGQTIKVIYRDVVDGYVSVNINANLVVLEPTTRIDARGLRTVAMQVATVDRYPEDDTTAVVGQMGQSTNNYTHPQQVPANLITGAGGTVAPIDATYVTNTANASLTNEALLNENVAARLATVASVDLNTTGKTNLYTVPAGKSCIIAFVVVRNASTSLTTASYGMGFDAGGTDVITDQTHTDLTGATLYDILRPHVGAVRGAAADVFGVKCSTPQGGAATVTIDVYGYLY